MKFTNPSARSVPGVFPGVMPQIYNATPSSWQGTPLIIAPPVVKLGTTFLVLTCELDAETRYNDTITFSLNTVPIRAAPIFVFPKRPLPVSLFYYLGGLDKDYLTQELFYTFDKPGTFDVDYIQEDPTQVFNVFSQRRRFIVQ